MPTISLGSLLGTSCRLNLLAQREHYRLMFRITGIARRKQQLSAECSPRELPIKRVRVLASRVA
jgi:hypothetical protein